MDRKEKFKRGEHSRGIYDLFLRVIMLLPAVCFLLLILTLSVRNHPQISERLLQTSLEDMQSVILTFEQDLAENVSDREQFINLNGGMERLLGVNIVNGVRRLKNGTVSNSYGKVDTASSMRLMTKLKPFFEEEGIPWLWLSVPDKPFFYDDSYWHEGVDQLTEECQKNEIPFLDMDQWFEDNGWSINEVYFQSDHHWRPRAAFAAAEQTMCWLDTKGLAKYLPDTFSDEYWKSEEWKDIWAGSQAERTGYWYTGVDNFEMITPLSLADYDTWVLETVGDAFQRTESPFLSMEEKKEKYYQKNLYYRYVGANYPLAYFSNKKAVNDMNVLVLGDSFRIPYEAFLTTQFSNIWHMDCRVWKIGNFAMFVKSLHPDLVLILNSGPGIQSLAKISGDLDTYKMFSEGSVTGKVGGWTEIRIPSEWVTCGNDAEITTYSVLLSDIEPGTYRLYIESCETTNRECASVSKDGTMPFVQLALKEMNCGSTEDLRYIYAMPVKNNSSQDWYFIVPEEGKYAIIVFAGVEQYTTGFTSKLSGLRLYRQE